MGYENVDLRDLKKIANFVKEELDNAKYILYNENIPEEEKEDGKIFIKELENELDEIVSTIEGMEEIEEEYFKKQLTS